MIEWMFSFDQIGITIYHWLISLIHVSTECAFADRNARMIMFSIWNDLIVIRIST